MVADIVDLNQTAVKIITGVTNVTLSSVSTATSLAAQVNQTSLDNEQTDVTSTVSHDRRRSTTTYRTYIITSCFIFYFGDIQSFLEARDARGNFDFTIYPFLSFITQSDQTRCALTRFFNSSHGGTKCRNVHNVARRGSRIRAHFRYRVISLWSSKPFTEVANRNIRGNKFHTHTRLTIFGWNNRSCVAIKYTYQNIESDDKHSPKTLLTSLICLIYKLNFSKNKY